MEVRCPEPARLRGSREGAREMRTMDAIRFFSTRRVLAVGCAAVLVSAVPSGAWADGSSAPTASTRSGEPAAQPTAATEGNPSWDDYSVEVYGMLVSRAGKVATLRPLVSTTTTPVASGTKAVLFRKIEDPASRTSTRWVEIARVTMKKIESTGNMQLAIESEALPPAVSGGKKLDYFAKGARLKLAIE
jgi:hypothetical protein